jgi:hypothetical protein
MDDCMACALSDGRLPLPGGLIHRTAYWRVEHCIGPLGLGTLTVEPCTPAACPCTTRR